MSNSNRFSLNFDAFARFAWFVLAYNLVVILWGVVVRASLSGDGCGQFWLTCHGEIVPSTPQLKTIIEYGHRVSSGIALFLVVGMAVWAFRKFSKSQITRRFALLSLVFIVVEALIGAVLVLNKLVALNPSKVRAFSMAAHLINTFILLTVLSLTAWTASGGRAFTLKNHGRTLALMALAVGGILLVGASGSLAALSSTLFPAESLSQGFQQDFSDASHIFLRLRISHPILSITVGAALAFFALHIKRQTDDFWTKRWANILTILIFVQFASGFLTLFTLAPIVLQLKHLLLGDAVWISFILMCASHLAARERIA